MVNSSSDIIVAHYITLLKVLHQALLSVSSCLNCHAMAKAGAAPKRVLSIPEDAGEQPADIALERYVLS